MKVFVAHTEEDAALANELAKGLRAQGFSASVGEQVSAGFSESSFADKSVERAIRSADCMLAVSTVYTGFKYIVPEMAFFAGNSNFSNTVVVTTRACMGRIPQFLQESTLILLEEHDASSLLATTVAAVGAMRPAKATPPKQIFLSYSRVDLDVARQLHVALTAVGHNVWFDEQSLIAGQEWSRAIEAAVHSSGVFLSLLSETGIGKRGVFQRELRQALRVAEEMAPGAIFIIPIALDLEIIASLPSELAKYHCIHLGRDTNRGKLRELLRALDFALGTDFSGGHRLRDW